MPKQRVLHLCIISIIVLFVIPTNPQKNVIANEYTSSSIQPTEASILNNESFIDPIVNFLNNSMDRGDAQIPSMDVAYYTGMSISRLQSLSTIPQNFIEERLGIMNRVIGFILSARNPNGGYANWNGSRSSMESTYQAITVLNITGNLNLLTKTEVNQTLNFINSLQTPLGGYYPLSDWDAPDISSTYRALNIKQMLKPSYPTLNYTEHPLAANYIESNFVPSFFINGATGYSENTGGTVELLATSQALSALSILGFNTTHKISCAKYLLSLTSPNGGVAKSAGFLPTTGFTSTGLELFFNLKQDSDINVTTIFPVGYEEKLTTYLENNKQINSGFTSSETDQTAGLSSTFFVLGSMSLLKTNGIDISGFDLVGCWEFLIFGEQPTFGFGDYPGDTPELSRTSMVAILSRSLNHSDLITTQVQEFVSASFDPLTSGFGFRPGTSSRVKYTYFGVRTLRALGYAIENARDISTFVVNSQTADGGFGQFPGAQLAYLSHTYWGIKTLSMLGTLDEDHVDILQLKNWLSKLEQPSGMFGNSEFDSPSIISTYRAIDLFSSFGLQLNFLDALNISIKDYIRSDGGFANTIDASASSMEATYYGILICLRNGIEFNFTKTLNYINNMQNADGGFALRPGFSSRVTSTYFAVNLFDILEDYENGDFNVNRSSDEEDIFSPVISPAYVPNIDANRTFQGTYSLIAEIVDLESPIKSTHLEFDFYNDTTFLSHGNIAGSELEDDPDVWVFYIGPFDQAGYVKFRISASDENNNTAVTDWMSLHSIPALNSESKNSKPTNSPIQLIVYMISTLGVVEGIISKQKLNQKESGGIKMTLQTKNTSHSMFSDRTTNLVFLLGTMGFISYLTRVLLQNALVITQNSIFLFRFIMAIFLILIAKYSLGIKTYGLFAPSVIVIGMLSLGPYWGLLIVSNLIIILIFVRKLLHPFNLPVGFRIGILMIFSITTLGLFELLGEVYRITFLSQTVFIPIIITPWIADRFVMESDQEDEAKALSRLGLTFVICYFAYFLMSSDKIVLFVATNPEIWILMVLSLVYFGRYQSYTKLDKKRFQRLFGKDDKPMSILIRNRNYITKYNSSVLFPLINKYNMKSQFEKWRVPTPETYAIIASNDDLDEFHARLFEPQFKNGFVIKPSQSFGGIGIIVVSEVTNDGTFMIGGEEYHWNALETECKKILQGEYLTSNTTDDHDVILVEERIICDKNLASISIGLPDIRVIVFKGVPVMAMARLPTIESDGKANLKQGAIGASINISDGIITRAEWKTHEVLIHPDTKNSIPGFSFGNWLEILATACLAQKASGLGYAGVDIVLDNQGRVLVLEVNKRPGLEIQNINLKSILTRIQFVEDNNIDLSELSPIGASKEGMKLAKENWE